MEMESGKAGRRSEKHLKCSAEGTALQKYFFKRAHERVARGEPIAWATATHPLPVLWAMDIQPMNTVNYSAIVGAKQMSNYYLEIAESKGYYRDLCRYCSRNIMGCIMDNNPEKAPWGGLARPTVALGCTECDPLSTVYEEFSRRYNVPVFFIERSWPAAFEHMEAYPVDEHGVWTNARPSKAPWRMKWLVEQFKELIVFLEIHTGKKLEESKLRYRMDLNRQANWYAVQIDLLRRKIPCPMSCTDWWPNIAAYQIYGATEEGVAHMRKFYEEVKARADAGIGVVEREKYRLLWMGYPTWFSPGFATRLEKELGAVVVWEYPHLMQWSATWDVSNPLEELAMFDIDHGGNCGQAVQSFGPMFLPAAAIPGNVDAAMLTLMESCKPLSSGIRYNETVLERMGIPYIEFNMDPVDSRDWNEDKVVDKIATMLEGIKPRC